MAAKKLSKQAASRVPAKDPAPASRVPPAPNVLELTLEPGKTQAQQYAETGMQGLASNAAVTGMYLTHGGLGGLGITESVNALRATVDRVERGDFKDSEAMLVSQAAALNAIFADLARRAFINMEKCPGAAERYLRLAFKAQSQARCTQETLSEIKNPRQVTFAKQVNNANGPQQVNNGAASGQEEAQPPRTEETGIEPIKLLEAGSDQWMDRGATGAAAGSHPEVEAMGAVNRTKV